MDEVAVPVVPEDETPVRRLARNFTPYATLLARALRNGVPPAQVVRMQWPFHVPDAASPPVVSVELTNECQLKCTYCDNQLRLLPRGFMSRGTFAKLVESVRELDGMVKVVGNGECTLHPEFPSMIEELGRAARHLSVATHGNWAHASTTDALTHAHVVSFSIDAGTPDEYEASRVGGRYERLLANVRALRAARRRLGRSTLIVVRLMLRPSQRGREERLAAPWRAYADAVFTQYVYRLPNMPDDGDLYMPSDCTPEHHPRCGSTLRDLDVDWTGDVPLCSGSARQVGAPGLIVGNVNDTPLRELWNGPLMRQYREGHRAGSAERTPICRGCTARY